MDYESGMHLNDTDEAFIAAFASEVRSVCTDEMQVMDALRLARQFEVDRAIVMREQMNVGLQAVRK